MPSPNQILNRFVLAVTATIFCCCPLAWAQDDSSSAAAQQGGPKPAGKTGAVTAVDNSNSQDQSTSNSSAPPIQELGHGSWLNSAASPLHWGSLAVGSFDLTQGYDEFTGGLNQPNGVFRTTVFGTSVVYNPQFSRANLAIQWNPLIGAVNGRFTNNLSNQNVSVDLTEALTPRLSMRLQDRFSYLPARNVFAEGFLLPAENSAIHSVQGGFLDGPGIWLTNNAAISLTYGLSARTDLTFTPSFNYSRLINASTPLAGSDNSTALVGSKQYTGTVGLNHRLSATTTAGLYYGLNVVQFENTSNKIFYQSIGGTYSRQLTTSWFFNGSLGATTYGIDVGGTGSRQWTTSAMADLQKQFRSSAVTMTYARSLALGQYARTNLTDRVDVGYDVRLMKRMSARLGFGYQHAGGVLPISGKYGSAVLGYQLLPNLVLSTSYIYREQVGDLTQVFTETRNTAIVRLSWDPLHRLFH